MKKMMKRAAAATLAALMAVGTIAGCSGNKPAPETTKAAESQADTKAAEGTTAAAGSFADYSKGFPEKVTIKIPVYDRGFEGWNPTDNYFTKYIQKEFGEKYNVDVQYISIGRTTEIQDYMQLIAAKNAPDIIFHYDMPQAVNYYNEGAMQPLNLDEIKYYAPTYYEKLGSTIDAYGELNGEKMFFFASRDAIYYNWITLIRQDWLDKVNMPMPTNRTELEAVGTAWKEAGLGTFGERLKNKSFTYDYPFRGASVDETELALNSDLNVAPLPWKPTEDYLRTLNKEYNDGIIDPEFYLKTEETAVVADFVSGKTGTYSFYITSSTDVINSLLANNADAKLGVMPASAQAPEGSHPYFYEYPPYGMVMGMNVNTNETQRAAVWMLLDWMVQPEHLFFLQNGVEGENYTLDENGIAVPVAGFNGESKLSNNNNKDIWCLVDEVPNYGEETKNLQANLYTLAPAGYEELVKENYEYTKADAQYGLINTIFTKAVENSAEYAADLNALWQELYVDLVTCKPEEFNDKYAKACEEYLDAGYQEILDEKQALLDEGAYK